MNKSKRTIKGPQKAKKKQFTVNPNIWKALALLLGVFIIVGVIVDQLYESPLLTIDGDKYYTKDLTYEFYNTESTYNYINQLYGGSYWDMPHGEVPNMTVRDYAKYETLNNVIYEQILYRQAIANGYELTEEEIDRIDGDISYTLNDQGLSEKFIEKNGFTREYLESVFTKNILASRYKQDIIDSFDIDDEAIKAGISYSDYRQYDIEYLYISTQKTNEEDYSQIPMDDQEKSAAFDKILALRDEALNAEDWGSIIAEEEDEVKYRESNFLPTDSFFSEDLMKTVMAMENGDITELIEEEDGYYMIRMINNNSPQAYNTTVDEAIKEKEEEAFGQEYNNIILPNYSFEINERALNNLRMGQITLVD